MLPVEQAAERAPLRGAVHQRRDHDRGRLDGRVGGRLSRQLGTRRSMRSPVTKSMPPPSAQNTSSWRHITPLGMPVVPPV